MALLSSYDTLLTWPLLFHVSLAPALLAACCTFEEIKRGVSLIYSRRVLSKKNMADKKGSLTTPVNANEAV